MSIDNKTEVEETVGTPVRVLVLNKVIEQTEAR
jgi:hypothetical protein